MLHAAWTEAPSRAVSAVSGLAIGRPSAVQRYRSLSLHCHCTAFLCRCQTPGFHWIASTRVVYYYTGVLVALPDVRSMGCGLQPLDLAYRAQKHFQDV